MIREQVQQLVSLPMWSCLLPVSIVVCSPICTVLYYVLLLLYCMYFANYFALLCSTDSIKLLCFAVLQCCAVLCAVLYCAVLCCAVLYFTVKPYVALLTIYLGNDFIRGGFNRNSSLSQSTESFGRT